jgi:hypothetical protein
MFCLYCGTTLPDDAVFCNSCGRRQNAATNTSDITVLPAPPLSGGSLDAGQTPSTTVPMVQGTPSVPDSSLEGKALLAVLDRLEVLRPRQHESHLPPRRDLLIMLQQRRKAYRLLE